MSDKNKNWEKKIRLFMTDPEPGDKERVIAIIEELLQKQKEEILEIIDEEERKATQRKEWGTAPETYFKGFFNALQSLKEKLK